MSKSKGRIFLDRIADILADAFTLIVLLITIWVITCLHKYFFGDVGLILFRGTGFSIRVSFLLDIADLTNISAFVLRTVWIFFRGGGRS